MNLIITFFFKFIQNSFFFYKIFILLLIHIFQKLVLRPFFILILSRSQNIIFMLIILKTALIFFINRLFFSRFYFPSVIKFWKKIFLKLGIQNRAFFWRKSLSHFYFFIISRNEIFLEIFVKIWMIFVKIWFKLQRLSSSWFKINGMFHFWYKILIQTLLWTIIWRGGSCSGIYGRSFLTFVFIKILSNLEVLLTFLKLRWKLRLVRIILWRSLR